MSRYLLLFMSIVFPAAASAETFLQGKIGDVAYAIEGIKYEETELVLSDGRRIDLYPETAFVSQDASFVYGKQDHGAVFWVSAGGAAEIPTPIVILIPANPSASLIRDNLDLATYQSDKILDLYEMLDGSVYLNFGKSYDDNNPFSFSLKVDETGNVIKYNVSFHPESNIPE